MMADAIAVHGLPHKGLPHYLASHSHLLASLSKHRNVLRLVQTLNLHVEPVTKDILQRAADISVQQQLLTNDAIIIAVMEKLGLTHLATNDDNFDSIPGITVWKPR
jgi:predicted nucleic acid-binding protein